MEIGHGGFGKMAACSITDQSLALGSLGSLAFSKPCVKKIALLHFFTLFTSPAFVLLCVFLVTGGSEAPTCM